MIALPLLARVVRLPRGRCTSCHLRRILYVIAIGHVLEPEHQLASDPQCALCAGISETRP